ncbi:MAG: lipoprotein [Pseudomonadota bacterium]|nr:lipoprotein [Pseudomonadota bacterium]
MTRRAGSVVATAARALAPAAVLVLLAACGQKGALIAVKPAPAAPPASAPTPAVVPEALPGAATVPR